MSLEPTPKPGCNCDVCQTLRANGTLKQRVEIAIEYDPPIRPFTQDWDDLMLLVSRSRRA